MKKLIIFGVSEIAKCAYEYFKHDSDYEVVAFTVDKNFVNGLDSFNNLPLIPFENLSSYFSPAQHAAFVAVGAQKLNRIRTEKYVDLKNQGYQMASYVSSKCFTWHNVQIGEHAFILENNTIQPFVKIGNNVTLWSGNHIGHGTTINDHCFISSHVVISGCCTIRENCFIGVNAAIADCVEIGRDNFVGMHSKIDKNTLSNQVIASERSQPAGVSAKKFCKVQDVINND